MVVVALSACAVGIAQAMDGESDTNATAAQTDRAERAALDVVKDGQVVSVAHDDAGVAAWAGEGLQARHRPLESFDKGPAVGRHIVVYLDRDFNWLQAKVEGYGPRN